MRGRSLVPLLALGTMIGACEASVNGGGTGGDGSVTPDSGSNGGSDSNMPDAPLGAWGTPMPSVVASTDLAEDDGTLSFSRLELVFAVQNAADNNRKDLYWVSRPTPDDAFGSPTKLDLSLTGSSEETPRFSQDDLTLYFASNRGGNQDVYSITRGSSGLAFAGLGTPVAGVSGTGPEKWFSPCSGGRYLVISNGDVAEGTMPNAPTVVASLSSANSETGTFITADCLTTYFASPRSGTNMIYTSTRAQVTDPWPAPTPVTDFMMLGGNQSDPWISPDQRTFVLTSDVGGTTDVYFSTR